MGYFDKLAENSFKEINGAIVYYPNGAIGKGRIIPNEEIKVKIFRAQKNIYRITLFILLPYIWISTLSRSLSFKTAGICALVLVGIYVWQQFLIKDLVVHESKLGLKEAMQKGSKTLPDWYYWILGMASTVLIALGLLLPFLFNKPYESLIMPIIGISSFGLLGLSLSIKMYKLKHLSKD